MTMTEGVINEKMLALIRETLPSLETANEQNEKAIVPVLGMSPHFVSFARNVPENGLVYLFAVTVDGKQIHLYLKQH